MSFSTMLYQMGAGMTKSLLIFVLTIIFSMPLGMIVTFGRMSKNKILKNIVKFYISVVRGTPLMLQLLVIFYGPFYLFKANIGGFRFPAVVIGFSLNYAAYFAEIYRSGIESIPVGQYEAANILGYSKQQTFMRIILPQMVKRILPTITNETITLVKDTSLAFAIAYQEMFTVGKQIAASQTSFMPFIIAGVFYYVSNLVVAFVMEKAEDKLSYYH
mgnify:FL=1